VCSVFCGGYIIVSGYEVGLCQVLKVCDVRVGVLPVVMWVQVCYGNENDSLYVPLGITYILYNINNYKT